MVFDIKNITNLARKITLTIFFILIPVSCVNLHEPRIVKAIPEGCLSKGILIDKAYESGKEYEYIARLKRKATKIGANTISCCTVFPWEDPNIEEWVVAVNPKTKKPEHVFGVKAEAFSCKYSGL